MSINFQALTLGEGELYLDDQKIGPVTDIRITKEVQRFVVETADRGEFVSSYLVPVRRGYTISMNVKELAPPALSYFLSGGESTKINGGSSPVKEYLRLYPEFSAVMKYVPSDSVAVKSLSTGITYAEGVDYAVDALNRKLSRISSGSIIPGELLEVTYNHQFPPSREIELSEQQVKTAKVEVIHRYPDGESVLSIVFRKVELDASGIFSIEGDELIGVPIYGRCLADNNEPNSPFGYVRIYGNVMSNMNLPE